MKDFSSLKKEAEKNFNNIFLKSFLECVKFGELILRFFELRSLIKRCELAEKPEILAYGLEDLLGDWAKVKEEEIIQKLYTKIGMKFTKLEGYTFQDYVKDAKTKYIASYLKTKPTKK